MNILDVTQQGYVVIGLQNAGDAPKTVLNKFYVGNRKLSDWLPVYKSAEYRYDVKSDTIKLNRDYKWEPTTFLNFALQECNIEVDEFVEGVIPQVKEINEAIIGKADELFSLPDPNELIFTEEYEDAISNTLLIMDSLINKTDIVTLFEKDEKKAIIGIKELEMRLEVVGAMYSLYRSYLRILRRVEG